MRLGDHNSDSAVPGLNRDIALSLEIDIPDLERVNIFNNTMSPLSDKLRINNLQINQLINIRDYILPKLMTGEIQIN